MSRREIRCAQPEALPAVCGRKSCLSGKPGAVESGSSVIDVAASHLKVGSSQPRDGENFLYSGTGAVAKVKRCASSHHSGQTLFTTIDVYAEDVSDEAAMQRLITSYTQAVAASQCVGEDTGVVWQPGVAALNPHQ